MQKTNLVKNAYSPANNFIFCYKEDHYYTSLSTGGLTLVCRTRVVGNLDAGSKCGSCRGDLFLAKYY